MNKKVRTRFAPSPTGSMHIGNLRTAFYAYALAKHNRGDFILRIEDTDKKREIKGGVDQIKNLLNIFGIEWDEYYVQSERLSLYEKAAEELVKKGYAFYCNCKAKDVKHEGYSKELRDPCRDKNLKEGAIKLKVPDNQKISFTDFILEREIAWNTSDVSDTTLLKSDKFPTYHLAVVVDDHEMEVSHVLRGHDWMPSTPIHLLVYKYLAYQIPNIGHLTDILDPEGGKLSKRKGSTSCEGLIAEGYLPEAIFNFVILLGWAPKDNREFFTREEFVKYFSIEGLQKSNPVFNKNKLDWFNGEYIRKTQDFILKSLMYNFYQGKYSADLIEKTIPLVKERLTKLSDYRPLAGFFFEKPGFDKQNLSFRSKRLFGPNYEEHLKAALSVFTEAKEWDNKEVNKQLMDKIKDKGFKTGDFFMDLRIAITGSRITPPISESIVILGKEETLKRLTSILSYKPKIKT